MTDRAQADVVAGYPVVRRLGAGGMGAVYLVRHPQLHKLMALKVMTVDDDERARARFLREAALAASLDHPHLVTVYDQDEVDGVLHLTMQHVDGPDLGRLLRRGPLSHAEVAEGVLQLAGALDALHDAGLVHRDVKPSNVLVHDASSRGGRQHWMLADFGIARALDETSELTGAAFIGSVAYSAPERFRGDPGSRSTDVFALACLAHEAFTGAPPFGRDLHSVLGNHARSAAPAGMADLPPRLADVLRSGLHLAPQRRTPSAGEFATALAEAVQDPRGLRSPAGGRHRRPAVLSVVLSAGLVVSAVVTLALVTSLDGIRGRATAPGASAASASAQLQIYTALPSGAVPGGVASDGAGGAWVTDDAGSRVFHVAPSGVVTSSVVPAVAGRQVVPLPEATADDRSVSKSSATTSRRLLRPDGAGGVWFADGSQVGRVTSSGAVQVLRTGAPDAAVDLLPEGGGAWLSLQGGDVLRVVVDGEELRGKPASGTVPGVLWPETALERRWAVTDGSGGEWVLDAGELREVVGTSMTDVPLSGGGPLLGTDLVRGPDAALFWLDDATGRVGRLDPSSASFPEYLPVPAGTVPRGLAVGVDRLLVTSMGSDGRAGLLALPPDGVAADSGVTDEQRGAVSDVLDAYRSAHRACGVGEGQSPTDDQLPCLAGPLRALDDGLAEISLPSTAGLVRDEVRSVADAAAEVSAGVADPEALALSPLRDQYFPSPPARLVDVAMSVDRLRTALGQPRRGAVI